MDIFKSGVPVIGKSPGIGVEPFRHLDIGFLPASENSEFLPVSERLAEVLIAHGSRTRPSWGLIRDFFLFCK